MALRTGHGDMTIFQGGVCQVGISCQHDMLKNSTSTLTTSHQILAFMVNMRCLDLLCSVDLVSKQTMSCTNAHQVYVQRYMYIVLWDWWRSLLPHPVNPCCTAHKTMVTPTVKSWSFSGLTRQIELSMHYSSSTPGFKEL